MKRTQSATFVTENRKPVAAAGTKTIARNKVHTKPRTNARLGLCPSRSKISGTTTNGRRIAAKVAATIQTVVAVSAMAFRATASNRQKVSVGLPSPDHVLSSARAIRPAEAAAHENRGHWGWGDGPRHCGARGAPRPRSQDAGHQAGLHRPRDGTDPLVH